MPELRADIASPNNLGQTQSARSEVARTTGNFKGEEVRVIDQQSLIADAAEELTSELSEETEKDISDREVEDGKKAESLERLWQVTEAREMLDALGDLDKRDLNRALKALLQQQSNNPRELREKAQEQFEEPAHQYAALKSLVDALKQRGAPDDQIEAANEALNQLMEEEGLAVHAALNVGTTANEFVRDGLGNQQTLRDGYRTNVHDYTDNTAVMKDLVQRFGEDNVEKAIQFMTKALGADLDAVGSSLDKAKLNVILNDMHRLETLTTVLGNCKILVKNAQANGASEDFSPVKLLQEVVPLQDSPRIVPDQIDVIPEKAGLDELSPQINFLNDFREMARLIPLKSFVREETRDNLLEATQDALDAKIRLEEEEEYE